MEDEIDFNIQNEYDNSQPYIPPENPGLDNSERIFEQYYLTNQDLKGKLFNINFLFTIEDNIRNIRVLNSYQIEYMKCVNYLCIFPFKILVQK